MYIKEVNLKDFRNYVDQKVNFTNGVNIIYGKNAQGKTNLVESLYLLSCSKSFKTSHDSEMIRYGEKSFCVSVDVEKKFGNLNLKCEMIQNESKNFYINSNKISKVSEIFGNLCIIFFSPDEIFLVKGSPQDRRDFMDTDISQISSVYYEIVSRFEKVLINRNKLLKTKDEERIKDTIAIWDEQFAFYASKIIITRKKFIEKLILPANKNLTFITEGKETLTLEYDGEKGETEKEIRENLLKSLKRTLRASIDVGYTIIGPQRDDIIIKINGNEVKNYGSQGQARSVVLALKLAELEIFEKELGEKPILVLDDVFSELDSKRKNKLLEKVKDCQTIITCVTNRFGKSNNFNFIKISNGKQI